MSFNFKNAVYSILRIPPEDNEDNINIGEFIPGSSLEVVKSISTQRIKLLGDN